MSHFAHLVVSLIMSSNGCKLPVPCTSFMHPLRPVRRHVVVRVLADVHLDQVARPVQQFAAVLAQMPEVHPLAQLLVPLGQRVDRLQPRLVVDAAEVEVDHDIVRVVLRRKQVAEAGDGAEEEHAVELVDLAPVLVDLDVGDEVLALVPREDERR